MGLFTLVSFLFATDLQTVQDYTLLQSKLHMDDLLMRIFSQLDIDGNLFYDTYSVRIIEIISTINVFFMISTTAIVVMKQQYALIRDLAFPGFSTISANREPPIIIPFMSSALLTIVIQTICIVNPAFSVTH